MPWAISTDPGRLPGGGARPPPHHDVGAVRGRVAERRLVHHLGHGASLRLHPGTDPPDADAPGAARGDATPSLGLGRVTRTIHAGPGGPVVASPSSWGPWSPRPPRPGGLDVGPATGRRGTAPTGPGPAAGAAPDRSPGPQPGPGRAGRPHRDRRSPSHRARRLFADAERRDALDTAFELRTAEQVAETLGQMKGALMKLGQMASYLDQGLPEPCGPPWPTCSPTRRR